MSKWNTIEPCDLALFTDFYELTMLQAYFERGMTEEAVFSLFVRRLPPQRNFLLACGLDAVLDYLEYLRFSDDALTYLASLGKFSDRFLSWLRDLRFTGDVYAVPDTVDELNISKNISVFYSRNKPPFVSANQELT